MLVSEGELAYMNAFCHCMLYVPIDSIYCYAETCVAPSLAKIARYVCILKSNVFPKVSVLCCCLSRSCPYCRLTQTATGLLVKEKTVWYQNQFVAGTRASISIQYSYTHTESLIWVMPLIHQLLTSQ